MRGNNVLGIIFAYINGERIPSLTEHRIMASTPFGGRYRLVDFTLSNMVNSGINKVGVITDEKYQSLMDHLGSGKAWDLSRKREGLYLLPPFGAEHTRTDGKIESLNSIKRFLINSLEEYVILSDCDTVYNMNYLDAIDYHRKNNADMTVIYTHGLSKKNIPTSKFTVDPEGRIIGLKICENGGVICDMSMGVYIMKKDCLIKLIEDCMSQNIMNLDRAVLFKCIQENNVYGYEFKGESFQITSNETYYSANMALMNAKIRRELFNPAKPIYTKVRDDMPVKYGLNADVKNCVIADGCEIDGQVENCVLFRGVKIGKGAKIKNCVIMQDTQIEDNADMNYIIVDKNVKITKNRVLAGESTYHVYVEKGSVV